MSEVEVTRDGGVLTLTLNRPDVLNAFNTAMHKAFQAALKEAGDASVRAVVITGEGRGFCVGQDLTEFQEGAGDIGDRLRAGYHKNILAIRALEKPVIAAVNGPAAGAGLSLACACDIRLAGESASFVPAFIGIGLVPDSGGSYFIARLLGCAARLRVDVAEPEALGGGRSGLGARERGRRRRDAPGTSGRAGGPVRAGAHARRRHDEAALRQRTDGDARRAARAGSAAAGGCHADGRLPRGRDRLPREAPAQFTGAE